MPRLAVTGATGFLGRATCLRLKSDYKVLGLGRNPENGRRLEQEGIQFASADLHDDALLDAAFDGVEAVVHCAARSSPWGQAADFYRDNVEGTEKVIAACLRQHVKRLVHISSPSIYFQLQDRWNIKEDEPLPKKMLNNYAASKLAAERVVEAAIRDRGLEVITLRPQAIFGPGDTAIIPRLIEVNQSSGIPLFKGRSPWLDITYVENVAYAIELALAAPREACGQAYNITNGEALELIPFLEEVFLRLGFTLRTKSVPYLLALILAYGLERGHQILCPNDEPRLTPYKLGVLSHSRTLDISRAQSLLGYSPLWTVDDGVAAFVEWWKHDS